MHSAVRHTAIVGAGPTGLYLAIGLARRGHAVTVVDRDAGPMVNGDWSRRGVMQFHHPHGFRVQVIEALRAEMPEVWDALLAAGAEPAVSREQDDQLFGMRCRRLTFERVLREAAMAEPNVTLLCGHAEEVLTDRGRAGGLRVDGAEITAGLLLDASGRAGRLTRALRGTAEGGECGIAYVSRQYQLLPGAQPGPMASPIAGVAAYPGYLVIVFPHDNGVFSTLVARAASDRALAGLRERAAFDAAAAAVPLLAEWTDPGRARPITAVLPGGRLHNTYGGQRDDDGRLPLPGLIFVGDAVCTTNPSAGRGVATSLMQARRLLTLLDEHGRDHVSCADDFDTWCTRAIRPWFADHVESDADLSRRWAGGDVDISRRLPSDLIAVAAQADPSLLRVVGPYLGMQALPETLSEVEPRVREIYASGWRPPVPAGPDRAELAELVARTVSQPFTAAPRRAADLGDEELIRPAWS